MYQTKKQGSSYGSSSSSESNYSTSSVTGTYSSNTNKKGCCGRGCRPCIKDY
ncbi:MAG: hypothetical protein Q8Q35_01135 [Nanoarchaeota archaeon]|nr:hypothetical protein [Nanoarchaeota archaeon]